MSIKKDRKRNRWLGFDYSWTGLYFVTICTKNREECLCEIKDNQVYLTDIGQIVLKQWLWLSDNFINLKLDEWIIMPNHVHGIIEIVGDGLDRPQNNNRTGPDLSLQKRHDLSHIVGAFKTTSSKLIHKYQNNLYFTWQRSFYDRVIRTEKELINIREYIANNPINWKFDRNNLKNT